MEKISNDDVVYEEVNCSIVPAVKRSEVDRKAVPKIKTAPGDRVPVKERFEVEKNQCYAASNKETAPGDGQNRYKKVLLFLVLTSILLLAVAGACAALTLQITKLKSEIASLNYQLELNQQNDSVIESAYQQLKQESVALENRTQHNIEFSYQQLKQESVALENRTQHNIEFSYQQLKQEFAALENRTHQKIDSAYQQNQVNRTQQNVDSAYQQEFAALDNRTQQNFDSAYQQLKQEFSALENRTQQKIDSAYQQLKQECAEADKMTQLPNSTIIFNFIESLSGQFQINPAISCAALPPSSPSGYYWVRASNGSAVSVYCDMTRSCGGVTGGWMRVAELDMTNDSHQCPSGLVERNDLSKRTCVPVSANDCSSVSIPMSNGYSKVCGKIIAYQVGSPNTFAGINESHIRVTNIDTNYVDGVSLTHGSPRRHIWTFAAGLDEYAASFADSNCPCTDTTQSSRATPPPEYVGDDYFCDTGSTDLYVNGNFYSDDPLWDGAGCGPLNACCSFNNPPWFYKELPQSTTDDIEMRVCKDQCPDNEDIAVELISIYVQ